MVGGHSSVLGAGRQLGRDLPGGGLNCSALNLLDINCVGLAISALLKMRRGGRRGMQGVGAELPIGSAGLLFLPLTISKGHIWF